MPVIGVHVLDAEREPEDNIVQKIDSIRLGVLPIDLQSTYAGGVVDGCVLTTLYASPRLISEKEELDVDLYLVARYGFFVAFVCVR